MAKYVITHGGDYHRGEGPPYIPMSVLRKDPTGMKADEYQIVGATGYDSREEAQAMVDALRAKDWRFDFRVERVFGTGEEDV